MDIRAALTTKHYDDAWVDRYLTFISTHRAPQAMVDNHHILPRAAFPEYGDQLLNPWNRVDLSPSDHLIAHYYLFRALPGEPSVRQAFKMMMGFQFKRLQRSMYSESLLREIAAAYETARGLGKPWKPEARQRRSETMKGKPVHGTFNRLGTTHTPATLQKKSQAMHRFYTEELEAVNDLNAARPSGENHWTYGKERDEVTRKKISQSLTGKVQSEETKKRRAASLAVSKMPAYTPEEEEVFRAALRGENVVATGMRKQVKLVLQGIKLLVSGAATEANRRYWRQANAWVQLNPSTSNF